MQTKSHKNEVAIIELRAAIPSRLHNIGIPNLQEEHDGRGQTEQNQSVTDKGKPFHFGDGQHQKQHESTSKSQQSHDDALH